MKAIKFFSQNPWGCDHSNPPRLAPLVPFIDRGFDNMLFRNIFENNSIRCILDKTLRLMLFAIDNFLKNQYNFAAVGVYVLTSQNTRKF